MINKNSILYEIPTSLPRRDVFLLEGIRYAAGIIQESYGNLYKALQKASIEENLESKYYYIIFKESWTIIDFSWKLRNLLRKIGRFEDEIDNKDTEKSKHDSNLDLRLLDSLKDFRHTYQHLDERIDEVIVDQNTHVWGNVSWLYVISQTKLYSCIVSPGHPRNTIDVINPGNKIIKHPICHINLESINRKKEKIKMNISELVENVDSLIERFEEIITSQLSLLNNTEKFQQDIIIKLSLQSGKN